MYNIMYNMYWYQHTLGTQSFWADHSRDIHCDFFVITLSIINTKLKYAHHPWCNQQKQLFTQLTDFQYKPHPINIKLP